MKNKTTNKKMNKEFWHGFLMITLSLTLAGMTLLWWFK